MLKAYPLYIPIPRWRKCMKCQQDFKSLHNANRLCSRCNKENSELGGYNEA